MNAGTSAHVRPILSMRGVAPFCKTPSSHSVGLVSTSPAAAPAELTARPFVMHPVNLNTTCSSSFGLVYSPVLVSPVHVTRTLLTPSMMIFVPSLLLVVKLAFAAPGYHSNRPVFPGLADVQELLL